MAFEYHWVKRFGALKVELVYFFDYAVIVTIIGAGRTNSCARGLPVGPTLFVPSRAKAIAIHIINVEGLDLTGGAPCNLFKFTTHFTICAGLCTEPGNKISIFDKIVFFLDGRSPSMTPVLFYKLPVKTRS